MLMVLRQLLDRSGIAVPTAAAGVGPHALFGGCRLLRDFTLIAVAQRGDALRIAVPTGTGIFPLPFLRAGCFLCHYGLVIMLMVLRQLRYGLLSRLRTPGACVDSFPLGCSGGLLLAGNMPVVAQGRNCRAGTDFCTAVRTKFITCVAVHGTGGVLLSARFLVHMVRAVLFGVLCAAYATDFAADTGRRAAAVVCQLCLCPHCQKLSALQAPGIPAVAFLLASGRNRVPELRLFMLAVRPRDGHGTCHILIIGLVLSRIDRRGCQWDLNLKGRVLIRLLPFPFLRKLHHAYLVVFPCHIHSPGRQGQRMVGLLHCQR